MKKTIITIILGVVIFFMGYISCDVIYRLKEPFPAEYIDKYNVCDSSGMCEECPPCEPFAKIEGGKIYPDCKLQFDLINIREEQIKEFKKQIKDLKTKTECYQKNCIAFSPPGCE